MSKKTDSAETAKEPQFNILPVPDKPSESSQPGTALDSKLQPFNTPGPVIPNKEALEKAGPPASSEELAIRTAELNQ